MLLKAKRKLAERKLEEEEKEEEFLGYMKEESKDNRIELCEFMAENKKEILAFLMLSTSDIATGKPESEAGKELLKGILKLDNRLSQFIESCTDNKSGGGISGGKRNNKKSRGIEKNKVTKSKKNKGKKNTTCSSQKTTTKR